MNVRIAIVLIVKNEVSEILSWLAWHFSLGCTTVFAFDDSSTDGTLEVLQAAAKHYDVQVSSLAESDDFFVVRQQACYEQVLRSEADNYDWIGFLDADEYVYLENCDTLAELLGQRTDADAVGFSWCNYGSSGHLRPPPRPSPFSYFYHSPADCIDSRHIKSFVRPKAVENRFIDVHRFAVSDDRYTLPDGEKIVWHNSGGVVDNECTWREGRILHFKLRSLSHFVKRVLTNEHNASMGVSDFVALDEGLVYESLYYRNKEKFLEVYSTLKEDLCAGAFRDLSKKDFRIQYEFLESDRPNSRVDVSKNLSDHARDVHYRMGWTSPSGDADHSLKGFSVSRIKTHWDTYLCIDVRTGEICHAASRHIDGNQFSDLVLISASLGTDVAGVLISPDRTIKISVGEDDVFRSAIPVRLTSKRNKNSFSVRPWDKTTCFCAESCDEKTQVGEIADNRVRASAWEIFAVEPAEIPASSVTAEFTQAAQEIRELAERRYLSPVALSKILAHTPDTLTTIVGPVGFSLLNDRERHTAVKALHNNAKTLVFAEK